MVNVTNGEGVKNLRFEKLEISAKEGFLSIVANLQNMNNDVEKEKIMISLGLQLARVDEPLGHFHCLLSLVFQILVPKPSIGRRR